AISRYKQALDAQPDHKEAGESLRKAYLARGDAASAGELIIEEIKRTEGKMSKARLFTELAELRRSKLGDVAGARDAATKSIDLDPTNMGALLLLGDIAFDAENFNEAVTHYASLARRVEALDKADAKRMLIHYIDALARSGSTSQAKDTVHFLLQLAPDDPEGLRRAARVLLDAGDAQRAAELYLKLLAEYKKALGDDVGKVTLELGRALRLSGSHDKAVKVLKQAADLLPNDVDPINELTATYEAQGKWEDVVAIKQRRLDLAEGDERANLLLELGELLANSVKDPTRAAKTFVAALEERPDDRRVLTRLMKLYSEEKDWGKLVEVVLKLGEGIDDAKQKSKYIHTAAGVAARQMGDLDSAIRYLEKVLDLDPDNEKALLEVVDFREQKGDYDGVIFSLNIVVERAEKANDKSAMVKTLDRMGQIFEEKLGFAEEAVEHYERAEALDPDNPKRTERLAKLYATDTGKYLAKAVEAQMEIVRKNPFAGESYRQLRKLFTEAKEADPAWCCCQALSVLNVAEPDEERFYRRMRADNAAEARLSVSDDEWVNALTHESCDPIVTAIFHMIQPAILTRNAQALEATGYQAAYALDLAMHPVPMSQMLYYAGGVLGMDLPMTFQNPNDPGGISFLHAQPPCIVLGQAALAAELPTQAGAFIAARHLTYYRPGLYIRHLVPTGTGLRSWLFAAVKLVVEGFPVAAELESTVVENIATLRPVVAGPVRDQLTSAVTKLIQSGSIDLKKWVAGVDLSADRAGFLVAHDLDVACEMIKASEEASAALPHRERIKELTLFAVSAKYFKLRQRLGIAIDS
ncbi:MAG TPA: tetratricopeptide repeat protein, partial [Polyangiaceae bacterium]|nr:tetratricopeptide repeat protein [Polyangiaceae bacterium]